MSKKDLHKELNDAPILSALLNQPEGYTVPKGYFDEALNQYSMDQEYSVPEGYWDDVENRILERINNEKEEAVVKKLPTRWIASVAAGFIILFCATLLTNRDEEEASSVDESTWYNYVEYNLSDYTLSDLVEAEIYEEVEWEDIGDEALDDYVESYIGDYEMSTMQEYFND